MSISFESNKRINVLKQGLERVTKNRFADLTEGVQFVKDNYTEKIDNITLITENGETEILPNEGQSFSKVTVHVQVESESSDIVTGITDFTDFWADNRRMEIYDIVDTSEANIFDRALSSNISTKPPKYMRVTNKVFSIESMFEKSAITELPDEFDISNCENCTSAFRDGYISVFPTSMDFSKAFYMDNTFYRQYGSKIVTMPDVVDMSNAESAESMCYKAGITTFPFKNAGKVTTFRFAFNGCQFTEAELDLTSCTDIREAFVDCKQLAKLTLRNSQKITSSYFATALKNCTALVDFYIDSMTVSSNALDFTTCTALSVESLVNILNALSDNTGVSTTYTVKLGATNLAKLTAEQKQIATNKNIALA